MITISSDTTSSAVNGYQPAALVQSLGNTSASPSASASDTVQLSLTAQVAALQQEGMSVSEIASSTGLTTAQVDSYLGIAAASSSGGGIPSGVASKAPVATPTAAAASSGSKPQPTSSQQPTETK
jgi:hypothetical protein